MSEQVEQISIGGATISVYGNKPEPPIYKKSGLSRTEYRSLFTSSEVIKYDKAASNIDGSFAWLTGGSVGIDDDAASVGFAGFTYRDLLRTAKASYEAAPPENGFDMTSGQVYIGLIVMEKLGILDDLTRRPTILKGLLV